MLDAALMARAGILPGVSVTIRGAGVAGTPTITSSDAGTYRFPALSPGTYELEFVLQGFSTLKRAAVPVAVGSTVEIDVALAVGALAEMITVEGAAPVVNTADERAADASAALFAAFVGRDWPANTIRGTGLHPQAPGVLACAVSSAFTAILRPRTSPISACTRSSIVARRALASRRATEIS